MFFISELLMIFTLSPLSTTQVVRIPIFWMVPREAADFHDISHVALVLKEHEHTGNHVGNEALRTKAHDEGQNAYAGHDGRYVHAQDGQAPAQNGQGRSVLNQAVHQRAQGLSPDGSWA